MADSPPPSPPLLPPELERYRKIDVMLGVGTEYRPLAHLTQGQIRAIALYEAYDQLLKSMGVTNGIENVLVYLHTYEYLSPSIDRMGRQEATGMLKSAPIYSPSPVEPEGPEEPKWYEFWKRGQK